MIQEYCRHFKHICATFHPPGIAGETPGKSSNTRWAANEVFAQHLSGLDSKVTIAGKNQKEVLRLRVDYGRSRFPKEWVDIKEYIYNDASTFSRNRSSPSTRS